MEIEDGKSETWVLALDLDALARIVGTSRSRLVSKFFPDDASGASSDQAESEETFGESPEGGSVGGVAVLTAARRRPTKKQADTAFTSVPKELLKVGGEAVICHSLRSLERANFDTVLILVGYRGTEIAEHVHKSFKPNSARASGTMRIEIMSLGEEWSGTHAGSILRAKPALDRLCGPDMSLRPALIVTSDHLFDPSLLTMMLDCQGDALLVEGELHDTLKDYLLPATAVRVRTSLYAGAQDDDDDVEDVAGNFLCERVGRRIEEHDAFDAGLTRLGGPNILEALAKLAKRGRYFALCDALDIVARKHGLRAVFTEGRPWVAIETEEQYETTRVLLASPTFRDKIPIEVRYKKKPSAPSLLDLAATSEQTIAPAAATAATADEEGAVAAATCEYLAVSADGAGGTAIFPETDDLSGSALLVKDGETLVVLVPVEERLAAEDDESDSYGQMLLATTGLRDANDIKSIGLVDDPATTSSQQAEAYFNVVVERRVPLVGWVVLFSATAFQASSALVFSSNSTDDGLEELVLTGWRPVSAAICVLPLVLARRVVTRTTVLPDKPPDVPWSSIAIPLALGILTFWLSNSTYQAAFAVAASPNNVVLLTALTPLFVVQARFLRLYGTVPTINEVVGMGVGLLGALVCAIAAPAAPQDIGSRQPKPMLAATLSIMCVICHACYSITTKLCRQKLSAPDLHLLMELGASAINFALLVLLAARKGGAALRTVFSFDPNAGAFGVFAPTNLATYLYCGLVVDTFGTMGFVVALMYFDPLLTSIATLFEPLCAAIESVVWSKTPLPSLSYFGGVALLFAGALLIVKDEAHTKQVVNADAAVKGKPSANDTPAKVNSRLAALTAYARDKFVGVWRRTKQRARLGKDDETISLIDSNLGYGAHDI